MKRIVRIGVTLGWLGLGVASAAGGQSPSGGDSVANYATGDPASWPPESDAVAAAPAHHKILLENESVRVLEVTILPGVTEPLHSHRWPSVLYFQAAKDFVDRDAKGNVLTDSRKINPPLTFPFTMWKEPEAPHAVENRSSTETIRLIRVELKKR